ncbi:hypothetical protein IFM89_037251 [Coptis chinensis]|uniref:RNase H type-1 domain-containing protein n=1 Tax=Coptis chinensis TaxID=261450 RepID=A0A835I9V2_9MAGN|nr:hypothetical protein IFM89_037251 [Coptis chinensis]
MKQLVHPCWKPNAPPHITLNTDGACHGNPGPSGLGCVIRTYDGTFIAAAVDFVPISTSFIAEALAMRLGLSLAASYNIPQLHIQSDSEALISCIKGNDRDTPWAAAGIIEDIRKLFSSFTNLSLTHIYREANATADTLAQHGISLARYMSWHVRPPAFICKDLYYDNIGVSTARLV